MEADFDEELLRADVDFVSFDFALAVLLPADACLPLRPVDCLLLLADDCLPLPPDDCLPFDLFCCRLFSDEDTRLSVRTSPRAVLILD